MQAAAGDPTSLKILFSALREVRFRVYNAFGVKNALLHKTEQTEIFPSGAEKGQGSSMGKEYVVFYLEASLVCIVILSILLIHDTLHTTKQEKQIWFNRAIISFILYFISDAFWASVLGGALPNPRWLVVLLNLSNYILMSLMAYEWFMFMAASEKLPFRNERKARRLLLLPMAVSFLSIVIAFIVSPYFWISESGELNVLYHPMQIAAPVFYLVTATVISVNNLRKMTLPEEKKDCWMFAVIPLGVIACGMIQLFTFNTPTFCFGCTVMLLWFYIQHMQALISVDELTRLNNRGQINRYMAQVRYRENAVISVMMIDIDGFKQINDTFGHAEGDRALMLVSDTIKRTCGQIKIPIFIGRYGGDEYTLIIQDPGEDDGYPEKITGMLRAALTEKAKEKNLPYHLEVSIGYDRLRDRNDTLKECLIRADENLYKDKKARGAGR